MKTMKKTKRFTKWLRELADYIDENPHYIEEVKLTYSPDLESPHSRSIIFQSPVSYENKSEITIKVKTLSNFPKGE